MIKTFCDVLVFLDLAKGGCVKNFNLKLRARIFPMI